VITRTWRATNGQQETLVGSDQKLQIISKLPPMPLLFS